jgi:hypothetical protein
MLAINAKDYKQVLSLVIDNIQNKKVAKKFSVLKKYDWMHFNLSLPTLISKVLNSCTEKAIESGSVTILLDQINNNDCFDHLQWLSLIPSMLGQPELKVHIVAINNSEPKVTTSNARSIIDHYITNELNSGQFTAEIYESTLEDCINTSKFKFDVVINNFVAAGDIFEVAKNDVLRSLIEQNIPYVIVDFTEVGLLNNYNFLRSCGFTGTELIDNKLGFDIKKPLKSIVFKYGQYILPILNHEKTDEDISFSKDTLQVLQNVIITRLESSDSLRAQKSDLLQSDGKLQIFEDVYLDTNTSTVVGSYFGDTFKFTINECFCVIPDQSDNLSAQADRAHWRIVVYSEVLRLLAENKEKKYA